MASAVLLLGACSPAAPPAEDPFEGDATAASGAQRAEVEIIIGEWFIALSGEEPPSGDVKLVIRNYGQYVHEIEVIRKLGEYQEYEVAEIEDIAPGETRALGFQFSPGTYELACTIVERKADGRILNHYQLGMFTFIDVPEP